MYKLLSRHKDGKYIRDNWNCVGRGRFLKEIEIEKLATDLNTRIGSTIGTNEIKDRIKKSQIAMVEHIGRVPITKLDIQPHRKTLSNYSALIANNPIVSICSSVVPKTNTRYTAENSLISSMAFLCVIALTHYDIATEIDHDIEK